MLQTVEWAIERGPDSYILNDLGWPYIFCYTLTKCTEGFNIDWDMRNDINGNICVLQNRHFMGTLDFDTAREGAAKFAEQINERVPPQLWRTAEEYKSERKEIDKQLNTFFKAHCADLGDCPFKADCQVRWAGGFGLRGCIAVNWRDEMHAETIKQHKPKGQRYSQIVVSIRREARKFWGLEVKT